MFLQSMGISTDDVWTLFLLIDQDDSGALDIDEHLGTKETSSFFFF